MRITNALPAASLLLALAGCVPHKDVAADQIPQLTKLDDVMDVQATVMDPQFKKMNKGTYTDEDWAGFADAGNRIQATSLKIKDFSKGAGFDALALQLNEQAKALSVAANAKDAAASAKALAEMKATCKDCHKKFR